MKYYETVKMYGNYSENMGYSDEKKLYEGYKLEKAKDAADDERRYTTPADREEIEVREYDFNKLREEMSDDEYIDAVCLGYNVVY